MSVSTESDRRAVVVDTFLRLVCACILLATGCLKLVAIQRGGGGAHQVFWFLAAVSLLELAVASLILLRPRHALTRFSSLALCAAFVGASGVAMGSTERCKCFGDLQLLPLDRLLVALSLFLGLCLCYYLRPARPSDRRWLWMIPVFVAAGGLVETVSSSIPAAAATVPESLVNTLPSALERGEWQVLVVRAACPTCRDYLAAWRRTEQGGSSERSLRRALLVLGQDLPWIDSYRECFNHSWSITDSPDLHIATPCELRLRDGQMVHSRGGSSRD